MPSLFYVRSPVDKGPLHLCEQCGQTLLPADQLKLYQEQVREKETARKQRLEQLDARRKSGTLSLRDLLGHFRGETIGVNALLPGSIESATLLDVQVDHFTVWVNGVHVHIPFSQVIRAVTSPDGKVSAGLIAGDYPLVVKVFDYVIYKGRDWHRREHST
jgi:hypothetical protein